MEAVENMNEQQLNKAQQAIQENPKTNSIVDKNGTNNSNKQITEIIKRLNINKQSISKTKRSTKI